MEEEKNEFENDPINKQDGGKPKKQDPIDKFIEKQSTIEEIFEQTKNLTEKQASNKKKKEPVIIDLISGKQIDIKVLASDWQRHKPQYYVEFYTPMFRLLNLSGNPSSFTDRFHKEIADFKNAVIWGRFKKVSFQELRRKNKYSSYFIRKHWHYQGLNDDGIELLQLYIRQAIEVMNDSTNYFEFRQKMYEKYGLGYQTQTS